MFVELSRLFFICIIKLQMSSEFCPPRCICDWNFSVTCCNASLEVVPIQLNPISQYINLTRNSITRIHYTLVFYNSLLILDLSHNLLVDIASSNFESQNKLFVLYLNDNFLTELKSNAFIGLFLLSELNLKNNKIIFIHRDAFSGLEKIIWLDLSFNLISRFENQLFRYFSSLEWLSLKKNMITAIPQKSNLEHVTNLRNLDMSMNLLSNLKNASLGSLYLLTWLNLSNNLLKSIDQPDFHKLINIKVLDISHNKLNVSIFKCY